MSRYKDGDPLPADDQSFVVDSVFTHHPDKAAKAGAGIDHVMVCSYASESKHSKHKKAFSSNRLMPFCPFLWLLVTLCICSTVTS